ncbi:MAG TPA: 50S ribosomal protein L4 [Sedimentisphaerales bacterium]|nr:50S ribosomal protein L4 [Sedimentisphaerales bacterium]
MIDLAIYNKQGEQVGSFKVDEAVLGGRVRHSLLKQAVVMYHANKRLGTATTKGRGLVAGSTRKLYKQKGTGNARAGNIRTPVRKGGGVAFGKKPRDFSQTMPARARQLAKKSAVLAKMLSGDVLVIDALAIDAPKTRDFAGILKKLKIDRSCLVAVNEYNENIYKSARNIANVAVMPVAELNAGDVCNRRKMLFTKDALTTFVGAS